MAADIDSAVKGGTIYEITPQSGRWKNGMEYGEKAEFTFHLFFVKDGYAYDPMFSNKPVLLKEYLEQYSGMNAGKINVKPLDH